MPGNLPRLTKPQMARLVEIGSFRSMSDTVYVKPITTRLLEAIGLVEVKIHMGARKAHLTLLGVRVLAGLPGDEFDRFRVMLREFTHADA